jgi:hypothetical protein
MTVAILAPEERTMPVEGESAQIRPTPQAVYGLIFLTLSPFSKFTINTRLVASAAIFLVYVVLRPKILGTRSLESLQILDKGRLRQIYIWSVILFFHAILCSLISWTILLENGDASGVEILYRNGAQLGSLLLAFFQIGCGFHMAKYISPHRIRIAIYTTFWMTLGLCVYQNLAYSLDLRYVGTLAYDPVTGLRPSALAMEPKFLSSYLLCVVSLLLTDGLVGRTSKFVASLPRILGIALGLYFFLQTASGNGYASAAILVTIYFLAFPSARKALLVVVLALVVSAILFVNGLTLSDFSLRESHQSIIENIFNIDLGLFDDLIALPMMAWMDNPLSVLIGFGPGLMHFFASRHLDQATWLPGDTLIEGNVSAIMYVSNFGLLVALGLFLYVLRRAQHAIESAKANTDRPLQVCFLSMFVLGAAIGGNNAVPLFLSIGWILGTARGGSMGVHQRAVSPGPTS